MNRYYQLIVVMYESLVVRSPSFQCPRSRADLPLPSARRYANSHELLFGSFRHHR